MPQISNLRNLLGLLQRANTVTKPARQLASNAGMTGLQANAGMQLGQAFAPSKSLEQGIQYMMPGTYLDMAANGIGGQVGAGIKNKKDSWESAIAKGRQIVDPYTLRDEFHSAYDPSGKYAALTRGVADVLDVPAQSVMDMAMLPIPGSAPFVAGGNALMKAATVIGRDINLPGINTPDRYKIPTRYGADEAYDDYDREYNQGVYQHNANVNQGYDDADSVWQTAQKRAAELSSITSGIVREGKRTGLSEKQIQQKIKQAKVKYGATGADILRTGLPQDAFRKDFSSLPNAVQASKITAGKQTGYGYNSYDKRR
jgi:hypothetical protein